MGKSERWVGFHNAIVLWAQMVEPLFVFRLAFDIFEVTNY